MKIYSEKSLYEFEPWSGAKYAYNKIEQADKLEELENMLEDLYPDGMDETQLNDLFWFDDEWLYEMLGMTEEEEEEEEEEMEDEEDE